MIDQNVQTTIGSPIEWYKLEIMNNIVNTNLALETYSVQLEKGLPVDTGIIRARAQSIYNILVGYLQKKLSPDEIKLIERKLFEDSVVTISDLRKIFWKIQIQLEKDNITRIDGRRAYDGTRVEEENKNFGD